MLQLIMTQASTRRGDGSREVGTQKMREHGIAVPRKETKEAKRYVARQIRRAIARGAKRIDPEARRFAR